MRPGDVVLTLLRHGRTGANKDRRLQGRVDNPLDEVGLAQAAGAAQALADVDAIVTSPLLRARQTAEAVAAVAGVPVEIDDRFMEIDYGEWEMRPIAELGREVWAQWRSDLHFRPPGGETLVELGDRVRAGLESLVDRASDQHVLVVCHVSPIKAAIAWTFGSDDELIWRLRVGEASISRIDVAGPNPVLTSFNERQHLP